MGFESTKEGYKLAGYRMDSQRKAVSNQPKRNINLRSLFLVGGKHGFESTKKECKLQR